MAVYYTRDEMHIAVTYQDECEIQVLFVEDNPDDYEIVRHMIEKTGEKIEIERASTGMDALKKVREKTYDIVFLDYRLPDMNGIEFMSEIDGLDMPVIFLTGKGNERVAVEALKRGACDYIRKDEINEETLISIINSHRKLIDLYKEKRLAKDFRVKKKRDSFSITISILSHAMHGTGKTQLVYRTNLNFGTMYKYLRLLMNSGLISAYILDGNKKYKTTEKGISFLRELQKLQEFLL